MRYFIILATLLFALPCYANNLAYILGASVQGGGGGGTVATQLSFINCDQFSGKSVVFGVYDSDRDLVAQTASWDAPGDLQACDTVQTIALTSSLTLTAQTYYIVAVNDSASTLRLARANAGSSVMQNITDGSYTSLPDPLPSGAPWGITEFYLSLKDSTGTVVLGVASPTGYSTAQTVTPGYATFVTLGYDYE